MGGQEGQGLDTGATSYEVSGGTIAKAFNGMMSEFSPADHVIPHFQVDKYSKSTKKIISHKKTKIHKKNNDWAPDPPLHLDISGINAPVQNVTLSNFDEIMDTYDSGKRKGELLPMLEGEMMDEVNRKKAKLDIISTQVMCQVAEVGVDQPREQQ